MRIERAYVKEGGGLDEWEKISEEEFLQRTEWGGYFKKGTALQALKDAGQIRTDWAFFRVNGGQPVHDDEEDDTMRKRDRERAERRMAKEAEANGKKVDGEIVEEQEPVAEEAVEEQEVEVVNENDAPVVEGEAEVAKVEKPAKEPKAERKPRGMVLGTIRYYKNGEAFRRVAPPKGWEYVGKTGSDKAKVAEAEARSQGLPVLYPEEVKAE